MIETDIPRYMDAGFPILYINTSNELKTEAQLRKAADRRVVCTWSIAEGYREFSTVDNSFLIPPTKPTNPYMPTSPAQQLQAYLETKLQSPQSLRRMLLVIKDVHTVLDNSEVVAEIKELALRLSGEADGCVILLSPVLKIPVELEKYITILEEDVLSFENICTLIRTFVEENRLAPLESTFLQDLAVAFKGLSEMEINSILALAVADDGTLSRKDLKLVFELKKQMIMKSGVLEMIPLCESLADIGGLENLKLWLTRKSKVLKNFYRAEKFGVAAPKGVLIAGVPGCGKSLSANAAAKLFEVPLLRSDIGKLMGKYLGESEANLRKAVRLAEAIAPCVLWVDELEKAFAGVDSENGHEVTSRLFGSFLTWMQEKRSAAFVVATANDITKLPPELLRKGRFDEIFYVGLPSPEERENIFRIHIAKRRKMDLPGIDLSLLAARTNGYSGADIEGVVAEAVEIAFTSERESVSTQDILDAIGGTNALAVTMKEKLDEMKKKFEELKLKSAS